MPTLKGKWYFKERLTEPSFDLEQYNVRIETTVEVADPTGKTASFLQFTSVIFWSANGLCGIGLRPYFQNDGNNKWSLYFTEAEITLWSKENGTWAYSEFRNIQFEQPVEVTEDFYNWLIQNAVNLQPEGTWRFNKILTDPGTFIYSHDQGDTIIGTAHDTETGSSQITRIGYDPSRYLAVYDIEGDGYNIWYNGSWYSEEARLITFIDKNLVSLNPEFALWFYENAHSMELKLYSECYIAETADKIRECTNDNTLTFKVSDLANGVQLAYDAGYSKGSSENSVDLEALGALCEFDWSTDSNSYPIFTVINHHPTYYLHADVSSTTGGNIFVIDNDEWSPTNGEDPLSYDTDLGVTSSAITVGPNDSYSCYIRVGLSDLTPIGTGVNTVYLKNMRWTASE